MIGDIEVVFAGGLLDQIRFQPELRARVLHVDPVFLE